MYSSNSCLSSRAVLRSPDRKLKSMSPARTVSISDSIISVIKLFGLTFLTKLRASLYRPALLENYITFLLFVNIFLHIRIVHIVLGEKYKSRNNFFGNFGSFFEVFVSPFNRKRSNFCRFLSKNKIHLALF